MGNNTRRAETFSVNPDGSDETLLTNNATRDGDPAFSRPTARRSPSRPGRETTFDDGGPSPARDFEIYKMSAETGERGGLTRLTHHRGQDAIPSWSPDGGKIAFHRQVDVARTFFDLEIMTMNPDGSDLRNISNNPGTPDDPATPGREDSDAIDSFATGWAPDGSQIAFGSTRHNETPGNQNFEIYKVNRDGSNPTRLTLNRSGDTPGLSVDYDHAPTWSPDGTRILFTSGRTSNVSEDEFIAYTMDAAVGEAGGLQPVAETAIFGHGDWQALPVQTPTPPTPPAPPAPPAPPVASRPTEDTPGYLHPSKMRVSRAQVLREDRRLDVFAPITSRARGDVEVTYEGDGRTDTFDAEVTSGNAALDRIRFRDLRAASQRAEVDVEEIRSA